MVFLDIEGTEIRQEVIPSLTINEICKNNEVTVR